jgi:hypothetical protein
MKSTRKTDWRKKVPMLFIHIGQPNSKNHMILPGIWECSDTVVGDVNQKKTTLGNNLEISRKISDNIL